MYQEFLLLLICVGTVTAYCPTFDCSNRECGFDGCNGVCGHCEDGFKCSDLGICRDDSQVIDSSGISCESASIIQLSLDEVWSTEGTTTTDLNNIATNCYITSYNGYWYQFKNTFSAQVTITTVGSTFDTTLVVLSGSHCARMACVTSNDDFGDFTSQVNFCAAEDVNYFVFLGGYTSYLTGRYALTISTEATDACSIELGMACEFALPVTLVENDSISFSGTTSTELANTASDCIAASFDGLWFTFTNNFTSQVNISTVGSHFEASLVVYSGSACSQLICAASNNDFNDHVAEIVFCAEENVSFYVFIGGFFNDVVGEYVLTFTTSPEPCHLASTCQEAEEIHPIPFRWITMRGRTSISLQNGIEGCQFDGYNGIWYHFNNDFTGQVHISSAGSTFDTLLGVFTSPQAENPCSQLACFVSNDDFDHLASQVDFCAEKEANYFVFIGGFDGNEAGEYILSLTVEIVESCQPEGSECDTPLVVVLYNNDFYEFEGSTLPYGNVAVGCELKSFDGLWYSFVNTFSSEMTISSDRSSFNTILLVFSGPACDDLACVGGNDNVRADTGTSEVSFCAQSNVDYFLFIGGNDESVFGNFILSFSTSEVFSCVLPGHGCDNSLPLALAPDSETTTSGSTSLDIGNYLITCESGAYNGIWFQFSNEFHSQVRVSTSGSDFDTSLIVLGGSCSLLGCVGSNDDADQSTVTSQFDFCAHENVDYFLFVGGNEKEAVGNFILTVSAQIQEQPCVVPGSKCLAPIEIAVVQDNSTVVSGFTSTLLGNALIDCVYPAFDGLWYHFNNPFSCEITISTSGTLFDTALIAMSGTSCTELACVSSNDDHEDYTSQINFCAQASDDYFIFIGGYDNNLVGSFVLTITTHTIPSCTSTAVPCEDAQDLVVMNDLSFSAALPISADSHFEYCSDAIYNGVWYNFSVPMHSEVTVTTIGSEFDTILNVLAGSCDSLSCLASNDNADEATLSSRISFCAAASVDYFIIVGGQSAGSAGNFVLNFRVVEHSVNCCQSNCLRSQTPSSCSSTSSSTSTSISSSPPPPSTSTAPFAIHTSSPSRDLAVKPGKVRLVEPISTPILSWATNALQVTFSGSDELSMFLQNPEYQSNLLEMIAKHLGSVHLANELSVIVCMSDSELDLSLMDRVTEFQFFGVSSFDVIQTDVCDEQLESSDAPSNLLFTITTLLYILCIVIL